MPRKARIKDEFGTFLISQNGHPNKKLFEDIEDKQKFIEILKRAEKKFGFNLYAYCLSDDNHYDLVIDVNGSDVSSIMKSINIAYAMYVKYEGKLFKDRYKSKLLESSEEVDALVNSLSCSLNRDPNFQQSFEIPKVVHDVSSYFEDCKECIGCIEDARNKLIQLVEPSTLEMTFKDKDKRNELMKAFRKHSTLSLKELGVLFGGISESTVCKILNNC